MATPKTNKPGIPQPAGKTANATPAAPAATKLVEGVKIIGNMVVITLPINVKNPAPSKTGKTLILAGTSGIDYDMLEIAGYSSVGVSVNVIGKK